MTLVRKSYDKSRNTCEILNSLKYFCANNMFIVIYYYIMQINYNDQQKKSLNQFLIKSLADNEILKKQLIQIQRKNAELIINKDHKIKQLTQQNQLLQQQLTESKERYKNLKREQNIFEKISQVTSNQIDEFEQSSCYQNSYSNNQNHENRTNTQIKQQKIKQQRMKYEQILKIERQKNNDCQRQIDILTDYINLKQVSNTAKIKKLEYQLKQKNEELVKKERVMRLVNNNLFDDNGNSTQVSQKQNVGKSINIMQKLKMSQRQKKALQSKLEICSNYVKQMQEFYTKQIKIITQKYHELKSKNYNNSQHSQYETKIYLYQQKIKQLEKQSEQLEKKYRTTSKNLEEVKKNFQFISQKYMRIQKQKSQGEIQQFKRLQFLQKNYQNNIESIQRQYEQKIQSLLIKLQNNTHMNDSKNILKPRITLNEKNQLSESKLSSEKCSDESFRFTPGPFLSSTIKQCLSKRQKKQQLKKSMTQKVCKQNSEKNYRNTKTPTKNGRTPIIMLDKINIE